MDIKFTKADFIYRKTQYNIYGVYPSPVSSIPEPSTDSPIIVVYRSQMYEKCVFCGDEGGSINFYFVSDRAPMNNLTVTSSEGFAILDKHNQFFTLNIEQNRSSISRYTTVLATSGEGTVTFKVYQGGVSNSIFFEKTILREYKGANDVLPVFEGVETPVSGSSMEFSFNTLDGRGSNKKQVLTVFCDVFLKKGVYLLNNMEKYAIDEEYDGRVVEMGTIPEYGSASSPQYVLCDGKVFIKTMGLKNGKNTPVYKEGMLVEGELFYQTNYDNPFRFLFNDDGSLSITNYGRCFMEKKAFYIIRLSQKYCPDSSAVIKLYYNV